MRGKWVGQKEESERPYICFYFSAVKFSLHLFKNRVLSFSFLFSLTVPLLAAESSESISTFVWTYAMPLIARTPMRFNFL